MRHVLVLGMLCVAIAVNGSAGDGTVHRMAEPIPGIYLVMLNTSNSAEVPSLAGTLASEHHGVVRHVYQHASRGFSVKMSDAEAVALSKDPRVAFVEEDAVVHPSYQDSLPAPTSTEPGLYHLDMIDGTIDNYYDYCERGGNVIAYEIGSGVWHVHSEFLKADGSSRVKRGAKFADDNCLDPNDTADYGYWPCGAPSTATGTSSDETTHYTGHDTAAASVLGGNTYGVAKDITIVPIRILNGNMNLGSTEYFSWGIDWIMSSSNPDRDHRPAVVSISTYVYAEACDGTPLTTTTYLENEIDSLLGYDYSTTTQQCSSPHVVHQSGLPDYSWSGIPVVVSANNQNSSDGITSPARMAFTNAYNANTNPNGFHSCGNVISAAGIDEYEQRWVCQRVNTTEPCGGAVDKCGNFISIPGSNYGSTVDIYAPAHKLKLASVNCQTCTVASESIRSGTSYAAPIVAGVVARIEATYGALSPSDAWYYVNTNGATPPSAINGDAGKKIIHWPGQANCTINYP